MKLKLIVLLVISFSFLFPIFSQTPDFELKVLDINLSPTDYYDIHSKIESGGSMFLRLQDGSKNDLFQFDGTDLNLILENDEGFGFVGKIDGGVLLTIGGPSTTTYLYFLNHTTLELILLHEFEYLFKSMTSLGDKAIFLNGNNALFVTDGTLEGTQLLNQFSNIPSDEDADFVLNDLVLFEANNQFWRSDGTSGGTFMISTTVPDFSFSDPLVNAGNLAYFSKFVVGGRELWKTDGTTSEAINTSIPLTDIEEIHPIAGGVSFVGETDEFGMEIWVSDGTDLGTHLLIDLIPGTESGVWDGGIYTSYYTSDDHEFFFRGGGANSSQLWKTDGTVNGTFSIIDFTGQVGYDHFSMFEIHRTTDGKNFFITSSESSEEKLWVYTLGLTEANELSILPGLPFSFDYYTSESKLFFKLGGNFWSSDGTSLGTQAFTSNALGNVGFLGTHDDLIFYTDDFNTQGTVGSEPHVSDGTVAGTGLLKDINEGNGGSDSEHFFIFNNNCYFSPEDHIIGKSIYITDGTENGTLPLVDFYPNTIGLGPEYVDRAAGKIYFRDNDLQLWVTDGTIAGSHNLNVQATNSYKWGSINDKLLFLNYDLDEIWVTNGTLGGTELFLSGGQFGWIFSPVKMGGFLWFFYDDGVNGIELYRTDGTITGTEMVFESMPGSGSIFDVAGGNMATDGTRVYFNNNNGTNGQEPWVTDGTLAGTSLLKDISPGVSFSSPSHFYHFNEKILFYVQVLGDKQTWATDGTESGTEKISDVGFSTSDLASLNGELYYGSNSQLWKTDGTAFGTTMLFEYDLPPTKFVKFKNKVFFKGYDSNSGYELHVTDGTPAGTQLFKDLDPIDSSDPRGFQVVEDYLFFTDVDQKLWKSDGTPEGTTFFDYTYEELNEVKDLTLYKGKLFFTGTDAIYGNEFHYFDFNKSENLSGVIFHDENGNGVMDGTEIGIENVTLLANDGDDYITYSDQDGYYEFYTPEGDFEIYPLINQCWEISSDPIVYQVETDNMVTTDLNFGLAKISNVTSAKSILNSGVTRCGFTVPFWISIINDGCESISGEMEIELDPLVEFVSADISPSSISGQTLKWDINELEISGQNQIRMELIMPDEQSVDEVISIISKTFILNAQSQLELADEFNYQSIIKCAIDPNDKRVIPNREDLSSENYTLFEEELMYTIRFQNTGNDTAFTVKILDTLSENLDWTTFLPLAASHAYRSTLYPGGIAEFVFENILLPDSIVNEPASHGFVTFQIKTKDGIDELTEIKNTAHIYFDFNEAVITNTINNTMVSTFDADNDGFDIWEDCNDYDENINPDADEILDNGIDEDCNGSDLTPINEIDGMQIDIFPNPTTEIIRIQIAQSKKLQLKLTDVNGKILVVQSFENKIDINVKAFESGVYFIEIISPESQKRIVKRVVKM